MKFGCKADLYAVPSGLALQVKHNQENVEGNYTLLGDDSASDHVHQMMESKNLHFNTFLVFDSKHRLNPFIRQSLFFRYKFNLL